MEKRTFVKSTLIILTPSANTLFAYVRAKDATLHFLKFDFLFLEYLDKKNMHSFGSQTFCNNNCSQGQMEKSQQELKRTRLRKRRFKNLAEIAVVYHDLSKSLLLESEDGFRKKQRKYNI